MNNKFDKSRDVSGNQKYLSLVNDVIKIMFDVALLHLPPNVCLSNHQVVATKVANYRHRVLKLHYYFKVLIRYFILHLLSS